MRLPCPSCQKKSGVELVLDGMHSQVKKQVTYVTKTNDTVPSINAPAANLQGLSNLKGILHQPKKPRMTGCNAQGQEMGATD